jgi:viroplasmin and RNaseH domain-containing protein
MKYYSVRKGIKPGIYNTWEEAKQQIQGFKGAEYKSFTDMNSAIVYYNNEKMENNLDNTSLYIFTDGSYQKNLDKHSYGVLIPQIDYKYSYSFESSTNNRNELSAILHGLLYIKDIDIQKLGFNKVIIVSDSDYCIKSIKEYSKKWFDDNYNILDNSKKNLDLFIDIKKTINSINYKIDFLKVKSHTNNLDSISFYNDQVDKIAKDSL